MSLLVEQFIYATLSKKSRQTISSYHKTRYIYLSNRNVAVMSAYDSTTS